MQHYPPGPGNASNRSSNPVQPTQPAQRQHMKPPSSTERVSPGPQIQQPWNQPQHPKAAQAHMSSAAPSQFPSQRPPYALRPSFPSFPPPHGPVQPHPQQPSQLYSSPQAINSQMANLSLQNGTNGHLHSGSRPVLGEGTRAQVPASAYPITSQSHRLPPLPQQPQKHHQQYQMPQQQYQSTQQPLPHMPHGGVAPPPGLPTSQPQPGMWQSRRSPYPPQPNATIRPANLRPSPATFPSGPMHGSYSAQPDSAADAPKSYGPQRPQSQQPQEQPQLTLSLVPRPAYEDCGRPRPYYHRGMSSVSDDRGGLSIPNSNSDFISIDDGCARIRFARLTINAIPSEPSVMTKSGIPLAIMMTPFANPASGEAPIPVVDFSNKQVGGPLRCERCNGYANPGFKFMNGGSEFQCNLCTHISKTPTEHFSPISHTGERVDAESRPELRVGSVEYLVGSPDYWIRPPQPARYLFAVDVSSSAVSSSLATTALMSIKSAIEAGLLPGSKEGARIGIMTFDRNLHFFDGRGAEEGKSVRMEFVPDIMDPFVPSGGDGLFLTPGEAVLAVESAIETHNLGPMAAKNAEQVHVPFAECGLGSALQAIKQAFMDCGGKAFVISGSIPTIGMAKLERRGGGAVGGGEDREIALLKEANSSYDILGCELADVQASVDLFLAPSSVYIDAATLSRVPRACGGRMYLFTGFDPVRDGASFHRALCTAASEPRAFEALLRVRTSPGIEARGEYVGHFGRPQRGDDVCGPTFDASSTLALELGVTSKLLDDIRDGNNRQFVMGASLFEDVCVQCAILFTDCAGRRRIRVHTVFAKKTTVLNEVFCNADVDATAAFLAKRVASAVLIGGTSFSKAWDAVMEKISQMFYVYRKHCTTSSISGQLILPESYKVLPVMMLGLVKSAALRRSSSSVQSGDAVTIDERAAALSFLISATVADVAVMCYPRLWEIQSMPKEAGVPLPPSNAPPVVGGVHGVGSKIEEPISMPNTLPLSAETLSDERILLVENGTQIMVWIGARADSQLSQQIIAIVGGRVVVRAETANSVELMKDVGDEAKRVGRIIQRIVSERKSLSRPQVVERSKPGAGGEAKWIMPLLIEDRGSGGSHSYVEYLRAIHKEVMEKTSNDSAQSDLATWEMLNHGY